MVRCAVRGNTVLMDRPGWTRYVALGDSITEGFCDPIVGSGEPWLGWADRLAAILDGNARLGNGDGIRYANLAVRGRRVRDVVDEQIPAALDLKPDLVSVMVGGNDLMTPRSDPDALADRIDLGVRRLREAGVDVLLANCFDPQFALFLRPLRGRAAVFNAHMWSIARTQQTYTLDLWGIREFRDRAMWSQDRVHLTSAGHRVLARRAASSLGVPYFEVPGEPTAAAEPVRTLTTMGWLTTHALPWVGRRLRRVSTGDGIAAKLPMPITVVPPR
ncbi:lysophospholipase L1-like esterase [Diaminobutyricimonas aerilata]|uniref:Lysophospholipase L1-like esterase n=2 Tax=Diaminobutyricimonas aerilata TaxID=1162967 RepID=A0A2M9CJ00_9MICO|nr:lysophospholipase L1-like esterase [Diaminobutyricimonas aerilata]